MEPVKSDVDFLHFFAGVGTFLTSFSMLGDKLLFGIKVVHLLGFEIF